MKKINLNYNALVRIIAVLTVINLAAAAAAAVYIFSDHDDREIIFDSEMEHGEKYVLYIGTNDKDTYTQLISSDEAKEKADKIFSKYVDGFTRSDAGGCWIDEKGISTSEDTLVYIVYDATEEQLRSIMDDVLKELNQNSILVEKQQSCYTYYNGK